MAKLNLDAFSDEYKDVAPKECACFLVECLTEKEKIKLKEDWNKAGGHKVIPWWKWCLDNINVNYSYNEPKKIVAFIAYDRYEGDEYYLLYNIETNEEKALQHLFEVDYVNFLEYGPDDCHIFQLQKVEISEEIYEQLVSCLQHQDEDLERDLLYSFFNDVDYEKNVLFSTDGCNDVFDVLNYYCEKNNIDIDDKDTYEKTQEILFKDNDLFMKTLKEYIADTYQS